VQFMFSPITNAVPFAKQRKVRMLAVSTSKRSQLMPELPTMIEAGVPAYDVAPWWGLFAPAKTSGRAVAAVSKAIEATARDSSYQKQLDVLGAEPLVSTPQRFSTYVVEEVARWAKIVKASGAKVE
jgi:tripartite-type tricarboxylate transporter receptor subunit TctC